MSRASLSLVSSTPDAAEPTSIGPELTRAARARRLEKARADAMHATDDVIRQLTGCALNYCGREGDNAIERARSQEWDAGFREVQYWRERTARMERRVRDLLDDGRGTPEHRADALEALDGAGARRRDAGLLTRSEAEVVDLYRAIGDKGQQAIRYLLRELASAQA